MASTPPVEGELIFSSQSSSMRSALAVMAVDLTSKASVLALIAWMLVIKSSTDTTASRLVARSSVLKWLSKAVFFASSFLRFFISLCLSLARAIRSSFVRSCKFSSSRSD